MAARAAVRPGEGRDQADRGQGRERAEPAGAGGARRLNAAPAPSGPAVTAFAPAKINLYLHLLGRRADGYHLLDSLIVFVDIGDRVTAAPASALTLAVSGPEAAALADTGAQNLVWRAAAALAAQYAPGHGAALHLDKHLPVASGIGGGSSDAAAALRALVRLWGCRVDKGALAGIAAGLGADVPACLAARPVRVGGIGDVVEPVAALPRFGVVLANPRRPLPTAAVFRARTGPFAAAAAPAIAGEDAGAVAALLASCRNDLTPAAIALVPEIAAVLERLAVLPGALLARMSGSGATCFALFADAAAAGRAQAALAPAEPGWWVRTGALIAGPPPLKPALAAGS